MQVLWCANTFVRLLYKVNKIHYRLDIVIIPGTWNFGPNDHGIQYITTVDIGYSDILDIVILSLGMNPRLHDPYIIYWI